MHQVFPFFPDEQQSQQQWGLCPHTGSNLTDTNTSNTLGSFGAWEDHSPSNREITIKGHRANEPENQGSLTMVPFCSLRICPHKPNDRAPLLTHWWSPRLSKKTVTWHNFHLPCWHQRDFPREGQHTSRVSIPPPSRQGGSAQSERQAGEAHVSLEDSWAFRTPTPSHPLASFQQPPTLSCPAWPLS